MTPTPTPTLTPTPQGSILPFYHAAPQIQGLWVQGEDAAAFLDGLLTNAIRALAPAEAQLSAICNSKGQLLHPLVVLHPKAESYLLLSLPAHHDAVAQYLEHFLVRERVQLGLMPLSLWQLGGADPRQGLKQLGLDAELGLQPLQEGHPILSGVLHLSQVQRGYLLFPPTAEPLWRTRLASLASAQVPTLSDEDAEYWRVREGWPQHGVDYPPHALPAEAGLTACLDFGKGCYIGQETHARLHYRGRPQWLLRRLQLPTPLPVDTALYQGEQQVGQLTSSVADAAIARIKARLFQEEQPLSTDPDAPPSIATAPLCTDLPAPKKNRRRCAELNGEAIP